MPITSYDNRRIFPRAKEHLPVQVSLKDGKKEFSATVYTEDISLSGIFFASTFYLKAGKELDLQFQMPNDERLVRARGIIVREVRLEEGAARRGTTVSGFAVRFTEFVADAKTILAASFMIAELDEFINDYLARRTLKPKHEADALKDVIIAWEVGKLGARGSELDIMKDRIRVDADGHIRRRGGRSERRGR